MLLAETDFIFSTRINVLSSSRKSTRRTYTNMLLKQMYDILIFKFHIIYICATTTDGMKINQEVSWQAL